MGSTFIFRVGGTFGMSVVKRVPKTFNGETYSSLVHSTLKLFKAVPVKTSKKKNPSKVISAETISHGFMFSREVAGNHTDGELSSLVRIVSDEIGLTPDQMNSSFHKSWGKVRDTPLFNLVQEQIFHYMTTYGYEAMGTYDKGSVFIPNEKLEIPQLKDGIKLTIIKGYTKKQLREKLLKILESGMALKSLDEVIEVAKYVELTEKEVSLIRNKEARIRLYVIMDLLPTDPVEFLRYMLFNTTEKTLIIVNHKTISLIKESESDVVGLFNEYDGVAGYKRLAEIFFRFKPLFLAFKSHGGMTTIINRISKLAPKYHKPMKQSFLNNVTGMLKRGEKISTAKFNEELERVNIWRKIRLAQSLSYRMSGSKSIMYKIRNGKAFATTLDFDNIEGTRKAYTVILNSIAGDLKHLKGKEFYIPENITYALPATEKQFTGNIPSGTYISIPDNMIFGVWWENQKVGESKKLLPHEQYAYETGDVRFGRYDTHNGQRRIDLDLHSMSLKSGHVGWNSSYRSDNNSVLFSGDITDAPNGASELLYINKDYDDVVLLTLNYFNFDPKLPVPYKIIVAEERPNGFGENYTVNPNNVRCIVKTEIDVNQKVIGLGTVKDGECRFYFSETALGDTIAVKGGEYVDLARDYLANYATNQITFNEILDLVGAKIVTEPTKKSIDLSLEALETDTFINLLINKETAK